LKAFIPEYIPAIGEVDAFLKMPRPDGQPETLGLYVLVIFRLFRINLP
jgi:intraflagellar transport protein 46